MEFEFSAGSSKLEREYQKRQREITKKIEKEKKIVDEVRQRELKLQKEIEDARLKKLEILDKLEERRLEEEIKTGGIKYQQYLLVVPSKSISDKLSLPLSALHELNPQDTFENGRALTFEVSWKISDDKFIVTHAGVVDFEATEGTVGVPIKVADSLAAMGGRLRDEIEYVSVRYVQMQKGTFVRLQPEDRKFQQDIMVRK